MQALHERLGARFAELNGRLVPRRYGDPAAEYAAARQAAVLVDRSDRAVVRFHGRDPVRMLHGLVSNDLAGAPPGQGVYAALLTPKGKMIADVRLFRRPAGDVLLDLDGAALGAVLDHFRRSIPPLFARFDDVSADLHVLGVYGPESRRVLDTVLEGVPGVLREDGFVIRPFGDAEALVARSLYTGEDGYDVFVPAAAAGDFCSAVLEAGARPAGHAALEVLRIEAGRPRWGAELTPEVIPLEAGLRQRAISETKGCYTGQEVIVRVLHRGHVNRLLRGLLLDDAPVPAPGAALVRPADPAADESRAVGRITSACASPRHRQTIALGYVRREIEPPATLRLLAGGYEAMVVPLPFPSTDLGHPAPSPAE